MRENYVTIKIKRADHKTLKILAAEQERSMIDVASDMVKNYIKKNENEKKYTI